MNLNLTLGIGNAACAAYNLWKSLDHENEHEATRALILGLFNTVIAVVLLATYFNQ